MGAVIGAALCAGMRSIRCDARAMAIRRKDIAPLDPAGARDGVVRAQPVPAAALRRAIAYIVPKTRFDT